MTLDFVGYIVPRSTVSKSTPPTTLLFVSTVYEDTAAHGQHKPEAMPKALPLSRALQEDFSAGSADACTGSN